MSIQVKNISKFYGQQKALDNVSFEIQRGDIVGFLGPNGAGKSTLMKIITGFIPPSEGSASLEGLDVATQSLAVRRIIGYLPENNPLYLDMYVREFLEFMAGLYKIRANKRHRIDQMIQQTGLTAEQNKKIGELSKGYRQRVGIAQALIHDPKVLILDEPTTGLDPNQIVEIRNLISSVGKEKTVMLSTHIMQEVEAICDKVIIINKGKIVAHDTTKNIQNQTTNKVQTIIVEFDKKPQAQSLENIQGVTQVAALEENNWLIQSNKDDDIRPRIFSFAVENQLTVLSLQKKEKSLEEVFQDLTKDR